MPKLSQPFSDQPIADWIALFQQSKSADERLRALQAIGSRGQTAETEQWATYGLDDADPTIKALAARLLSATTTTAAVDPATRLVSLLNDEDPDVRFEAARALIRRKSKHAAAARPVLLTFLDETETQPLMLAAVTNLLAEIDLDPATSVNELLLRLKKLFGHDRGEVREAAAIAFAKWPAMATECSDLLLPLLDDSEPLVREKIAESLGQAGVNNDAIRAGLQAATDDEDTEVARVARLALDRLNTAGGRSSP